MVRKGIRWGCGSLFLLLVWLLPVSAEESADEIVSMMTWWEELGRYWDETEGMVDFAFDEQEWAYALAQNTIEEASE